MFGVWMYFSRRRKNYQQLFNLDKLKSPLSGVRIASFVILILFIQNLNAAPIVLTSDNTNSNPNSLLISNLAHRSDDQGKLNHPELANTNNMDDNDTYLKYLLKAASYNKRLYSNKLQRELNYPNSLLGSGGGSGKHLPNSEKKVFKVNKNLQRLEKKSWKIPMKTIALTLYSKNSDNMQELTKLIDSFKDS